jgi:hypothetical protein
MKYHNIPSIDLLVAYKSGRLTGDELISVERAISLNPMVAGVAESLGIEDVPVIKSISSNIHKHFLTPKLKSTGFWSKYGGWIGLSSIVILLGIYGLTELNKPEARYVNDSMLLVDNEVDPDAQVKLTASANHSEQSQEADKRQPEHSEKALLIDSTESGEENDAVEESLSEEVDVASIADIGDLDEEKSSEEENTFDNTRKFSAENQENKSVMLAVSNVQILSKSNPDALNTRSTGGDGNPLGNQTTSTGNSFSVSDIPTYPGGDRALGDYFKGKLRPIEIPKHQDKFDRTVLIELTVNSRGKLKDYNIRGQLHPTHQDALVKAIEELPRFNKGSEKITYSLGVSF